MIEMMIWKVRYKTFFWVRVTFLLCKISEYVYLKNHYKSLQVQSRVKASRLGVKITCWKILFLPLNSCCQISWAINNKGEVQATMIPAEGRAMFWGRKSVNAIVSEMSIVESRKELEGDRPVKVMNNFGGQGKMRLHSEHEGSCQGIWGGWGYGLIHICTDDVAAVWREHWQPWDRSEMAFCCFLWGLMVVWTWMMAGDVIPRGQVQGTFWKDVRRGRRETSWAITRFWSVQLEELWCKYGLSRRRSRISWWWQELTVLV